MKEKEGSRMETKTVCRLNYWDLRCVVSSFKVYVFETMSNELEEMLETITSCIAYDEEIWIKILCLIELALVTCFSPEAKLLKYI